MQKWTLEIEAITYGPGSADVVFVEMQMKSFDQLGWIGLGNMGSRVAKRLMNAGYPLMVYDRSRLKAEELPSLGAQSATDPVPLAVPAPLISSCLNDGAPVRDVYF